MSEMKSGSQYSSGWRPLKKIDENTEKLELYLRKKIASMELDFKNTKNEFALQLEKCQQENIEIESTMNAHINELEDEITKKDEYIKKLQDEITLLRERSAVILAQLKELNNKEKGGLDSLLKKLYGRKSHQTENMHSID